MVIVCTVKSRPKTSQSECSIWPENCLPCNNYLITYMKNFKIAYYNYAEGTSACVAIRQKLRLHFLHMIGYHWPIRMLALFPLFALSYLCSVLPENCISLSQ